MCSYGRRRGDWKTDLLLALNYCDSVPVNRGLLPNIFGLYLNSGEVTLEQATVQTAFTSHRTHYSYCTLYSGCSLIKELQLLSGIGCMSPHGMAPRTEWTSGVEDRSSGLPPGRPAVKGVADAEGTAKRVVKGGTGTQETARRKKHEYLEYHRQRVKTDAS